MSATLLTLLQDTLAAGQWHKLTLSKLLTKPQDGLRNLYLRPVQLKSGLHISFVFRYPQRDITKNYLPAQAWEELGKYWGKVFGEAYVFTNEADYQVRHQAQGKEHILRKSTTGRAPASLEHDRSKQYAVVETRPYLQALGLANAQGEILASQQDKYRQINKYIEIMDGLVAQLELPADRPLEVVDMGCGKGYLTFGLYDYWTQQGRKVRMTGLELRPELVQQANALARELEMDNLYFEAQRIEEYQAPEQLDILIALHACDTATDWALYQGLRARAALLVTAPCCHKYQRKHMDLAADSPLRSILRHGILEERQAEILTDGLRALILEREGYEASVFEFISNEHTAKNLMIVGVRRAGIGVARRKEIMQQQEHIQTLYGLETPYLDVLLAK